jgi:DNA-binding XRE family transcriptional regulator
MFKKKINDISTLVGDADYITQAIQDGILFALRQHKMAGNPICIWKDNKVTWVPPEDIEVGLDITPPNIPLFIQRKILKGDNPIRVWREYRAFSQSFLAKAAKVSRQYISQLENNEKTGSIAVLKKIAAILSVPLDNLV